MTLDEFLPYILPEVLGAPEPVVTGRLLLVAGDFCRRTLAWTEVQDPVALVDATKDYAIVAPTDGRAYTVRDVWCGNRRLVAKTLTEIQRDYTDWSTATGNEPSYYTAAVTRGEIRVFPTPDNVTTETITMRAAYEPTLTATTLPDFLGREFMDVMASGVKSHLMLMPGVSWSNPALAEFYGQKYESGVLDARIRELHDRVPGRLTVASRSFGF